MRIELIVFGSIIALLVVLSFVFTIPENQIHINSSGQKSALPLIGKAPDFVGISNWINSEPLKINGLKGKVVLIDFWTYSCINCIRTLPYLKSWNEEYSEKGLVIVGVHTPEFEFEKDPKNVKDAVEKYGLKYPIAQDNDRRTWTAYKNNYWPRHYLIDSKGNIRYDHIGEGGYEETEKAIQDLLKEKGASIQNNMTQIKSDTDFSKIGSPEIYLGYNFARSPLGNPAGFSPNSVEDYGEFDSSSITLGNTVYLSGKWKSEGDKIISVENSKLFLVYKAKKLNIVAGGNSTIHISLDNKPLDSNSAGEDSEKSSTKIASQKLYNLISTTDYSPHILEISADPGFEIYTFTFG